MTSAYFHFHFWIELGSTDTHSHVEWMDEEYTEYILYCMLKEEEKRNLCESSTPELTTVTKTK